MGDRKGIYFGTIAGTTDLVPSHVKRDQGSASSNGASDVRMDGTSRGGNVNIAAANAETEVLELSETSRIAQEKHAQLLRRAEAERRARNITVPTSAEDVIQRLRALNEPATLFGERPADRRERLRQILGRREIEGEELGLQSTDGNEQKSSFEREKKLEDELFYIPIKEDLLKKARSHILDFSRTRAESRLAKERYEKALSVEETEKMVDSIALEAYKATSDMVNVMSQNADVRPVASVRYSSDGKHVATGSWSGMVKVWNTEDAELAQTLSGHEDRITGVAWHPSNVYADMQEQNQGICLCSGSADYTARLWKSGEKEAVAVLQGHQARLGKVAFHPSGDYVGTTSFDHTWRLWDVSVGKELLLQEGHYKEVYAIAFHPDGSLVATSDLLGLIRVWDLRSGKAIMSFQGHSKQVLGLDFAPDGTQLASSSDDRSVRIWDLRKRKCRYTLPAHAGLVADVRYAPGHGELLMSTSYDASVKLWKARDFSLLSTLRAHDGRVMSADFAPDGRHVVSSGFDRTFKFWAHESEL